MSDSYTKPYSKSCSTSWSNAGLTITYSEPVITGVNRTVQSVEDILHFYYKVDVSDGVKTLFSANVYECPLIDQLPKEIDGLLEFDMSKAYALESFTDEDEDFERTVRYAQVLIEDAYTNEYFYKLERYDTFFKDGQEVKEWKEFVLTIGNMQRERYYYDDKPEFGQVVMIKNLSADDLLSLKDTALAFCEEAIKEYQRDAEDVEDF